jgi:hypothetical protein
LVRARLASEAADVMEEHIRRSQEVALRFLLGASSNANI